jgi:hypothetical protein
LIAVLLDAAPAEYQGIWTTEQCMKDASVTLSHLQVVMNQNWCQVETKTKKTNSALLPFWTNASNVIRMCIEHLTFQKRTLKTCQTRV